MSNFPLCIDLKLAAEEMMCKYQWPTSPKNVGRSSPSDIVIALQDRAYKSRTLYQKVSNYNGIRAVKSDKIIKRHKEYL